MREIVSQIIVSTIFFLGVISCIGQDASRMDTVITESFSCEFFLNGKLGKIFNVKLSDQSNQAVVKWRNGFVAFGSMVDGSPVGNWYIFDKRNRIREHLILGSGSKCVLYSRKIGRSGKVISEFKSLTPCW